MQSVMDTERTVTSQCISQLESTLADEIDAKKSLSNEIDMKKLVIESVTIERNELQTALQQLRAANEVTSAAPPPTAKRCEGIQ